MLTKEMSSGADEVASMVIEVQRFALKIYITEIRQREAKSEE